MCNALNTSGRSVSFISGTESEQTVTSQCLPLLSLTMGCFLSVWNKRSSGASEVLSR